LAFFFTNCAVATSLSARASSGDYLFFAIKNRSSAAAGILAQQNVLHTKSAPKQEEEERTKINNNRDNNNNNNNNNNNGDNKESESERTSQKRERVISVRVRASSCSLSKNAQKYTRALF